MFWDKRLISHEMHGLIIMAKLRVERGIGSSLLVPLSNEENDAMLRL